MYLILFYKFLFQQYILNFYMNLNKFQSPNQSMPQFENVPEFKSSINENQELIKDLLEILREPKIKAKNDEEIIQQFSSPDLLSNDLTTEIMTEFLSLDPDLLNGFGNKFSRLRNRAHTQRRRRKVRYSIWCNAI